MFLQTLDMPCSPVLNAEVGSDMIVTEADLEDTLCDETDTPRKVVIMFKMNLLWYGLVWLEITAYSSLP